MLEADRGRQRDEEPHETRETRQDTGSHRLGSNGAVRGRNKATQGDGSWDPQDGQEGDAERHTDAREAEKQGETRRDPERDRKRHTHRQRDTENQER